MNAVVSWGHSWSSPSAPMVSIFLLDFFQMSGIEIVVSCRVDSGRLRRCFASAEFASKGDTLLGGILGAATSAQPGALGFGL